MSHILEFLDLMDVPNTYSGLPGRPVIVNATVDGVTFSDLAADYVAPDTTDFDGILSATQDTLQKALDVLDDHVHAYYLLRSEWGQNGFVDYSDVSIAWNDGTRTLTISPAVDNFEYYYAGEKTTEDGSLAATITDTEGLWAFYIGEVGATELSTIHNPSYEEVEDAILNQTIVAYVYWDATNNDGRLMVEMHGANMSPATHHYLHELFGAQYEQGLTLGDITVDQNGNSDSHAQFSCTAGRFYDEDLEHDTLARASTDTWECYYVNGDGDVRWVNCAATFPVYAIGGVIAWNSAGTLTAADNNKYILYHVFSTNIHGDDGSDYYPVVTPGIAQYGSKAAAQDAALSEIQSIDFGDWPKEEVIPVATVIYQHLSAMSNGVEAAIVSTEGGGDFVDWRYTAISGSSTSTNDHGALSGLTDDDHPQYLLAAGTRALTADWDAGAFEIRALTFESDVATGTAPFTIASTTVVTNLNADLLDGVENSVMFHNNVAAEINALTTVTMASTDVLLVEDQSDSWNKKKIAASAFAAASHSHTESDISDLDHDAVSLQGDDIYASITPTDGQVLTWDDANSRWDAADPSAGTPTAPKTTATTNATGTTSSTSYTTAIDVSSGPYLIHLIKNVDSTHTGSFKLTVDGTVLFTDLSCAAGVVAVGNEGTYPMSIPVRSSFKLEVKHATTINYMDWRCSYQAISVS